MGNYCIIFVFLAVISSSIAEIVSQSQCDRQDPNSCPINNGFQQNCVCIPFGGGCWCQCPETADGVNGTCLARPTKIGEECRYFESCDNIEGAAKCDGRSDHKCICKANHFPVDDLSKCIPKPKALDELCSFAANCEDVQGSTCQTSETGQVCKCLDSLYPKYDNTSCLPRPTFVGDPCSYANPCSEIPMAKCVEQDGPVGEPICTCPEEYTASSEHKRCLPTRIGVRCWLGAGSPCENLEGSTCWGLATEARCTCIHSIPNLEMTKCLTNN